MVGISKLEYSDDLVWSTQAGTWDEILMTATLRDGWEPATPEVFREETVDGNVRQNGMRWRGAIPVDVATTPLPAENTPTWFRITGLDGVTARVMGGPNGALCSLGRSGPRALSEGSARTIIRYTFTAATTGDGIKAAT
jgi:hypothetical protein